MMSSLLGAGIAGVCQARHLLLNILNIKIALVDPRPEERTDRDIKVGESTVEISTLILVRSFVVARRAHVTSRSTTNLLS